MSDPLSIWLEKKQFLETELAKASDASQKFTLRKQIQDCDQEILRLQHQSNSKANFQVDSKPNSKTQFIQAHSLNHQPNPDNQISNNSATHLPAQILQIHQIQQPQQPQLDQAQVSIPTINFNKPKIIDIGVSELRALIPKIEILLLTVNDWERKALLSEMTPLDGKDGILQGALDRLTYRIGMFGNYCAAYTESTMGSGGRHGATLIAKTAVDELKPKAVLLLGIAFGIDSNKQKLGDVLIAESIQPYEFQKVHNDFSITYRGQATPCGYTLSERFRMRRDDWTPKHGDKSFDDVKVYQGLVLSGDKLVNNKGFRDALVKAFPTSIGGEMEGAGAYSAISSPVEVILIKSICDWADGDKNDTAQPFAAFTAVSLAKHVLSKPDVLHSLINTDYQATDNKLDNQNILTHQPYQNPAKALKQLIKVENSSSISGVVQVSGSIHNSTINVHVNKSVENGNNYAKDILQLQQHSNNTSTLNSSLSKITIKGKDIKICRDLTQKLWETVQSKSVIVTGIPGSGKSGLLWDLFQIISEEQYDSVFLSADQFLNISNFKDLRDSIGEGLNHTIEDILKNWPGAKPGFLIIDALDKALSSYTKKILLDTISIVLKSNSRWKVIISIRKYDLEKNKQLQELFRCAAKPFEIFSLDNLSDNEIQQIKDKSQELALLIDQAEEKLNELIRNLFNLRLLATLITVDVATSDLLLIQTQVQLLNKYWEARIIDDSDYIREELLFKISEKMIKDKSLKCRATDIINGQQNRQQTLTELLSSNVLMTCDSQETTSRTRDFITFSHNILFDYTIACKLRAEGRIPTISETFVREPDLIFMISSSLYMYFRSIWEKEENRKVFWEVVFDVISSDAHVIIKIVGPTVACQLIQKSSDYEILINKLESGNKAIFSIAEQTFRYMVAYLSTDPSIFLVEIKEVRLAWCELLERCSRINKLSLTEVSCLFLSTICMYYQHFDSHQRNLLGIAARRFFQSAWE